MTFQSSGSRGHAFGLFRAVILLLVLFAVALISTSARNALAACPPAPFSYCDLYPQKFGFPKTLVGGKVNRGSYPAIADLGLTPGHKSIVFGTAAGLLYVVLWDGTVAPGFPVQLPKEIISSPVVGELDGDPSNGPEIVVGFGSQYPEGVGDGGVRAIHRNGTLLWSRSSGLYVSTPGPVVSAPVIGDLDGDGRNEVVWAAFDHNVHASDGATGAEKTGWPQTTYDTIWSSPVLFDLDGDGRPEIIVGSDQHFEPAPISTPNGGGLWVFRADGSRFPGFPRFVNQVIASSPAVGDIDGDGKPEIVVGDGHFSGFPALTHSVWAFKCDGTQAAGWPVTVDGQVFTSPALADLNGDGRPEVIVTDDGSGPSGKFKCYAFYGNGTPVFSPVIVKDFWASSLSAASPVVADIVGDSKPEILIPTNFEICVISNAGVQLTDDGTHLSSAFTMTTFSPLYAIAVDDLESDGQKVEVIAVSGGTGGTDTQVWAWNPKAPTLPVSQSIPWGQFHQSEKRLGVVPGTPNCGRTPTKFYGLPPCRIVDTRVTGQGAPALAPNSSRQFYVLGGACAVPADAQAISVNVTVTAPTAEGAVSIGPGSQGTIGTSTLSYPAGRTRANNSIVYLAQDATGTIRVYNTSSGSTHFILDVNGYFK